MYGKNEEFILDVRRAARLEKKPTVTTDSEMMSPDAVSKVLQRAALWLTPKVVETYDPAEFTALNEELQRELQSSVETFRAAAEAVPSDKPATISQVKNGFAAFERLTTTVRRVVLAEWTGAVAEVIKQIEQWSAGFEWRTRRQDKSLSETLLGEYTLPQLYLYAEGQLYVLDPLARFVPGALGAFDLSIQPSFYSTSIYRHLDRIWYVHLDVNQGVRSARREVLGRDSFRKSIDGLRSLL